MHNCMLLHGSAFQCGMQPQCSGMTLTEPDLLRSSRDILIGHSYPARHCFPDFACPLLARLSKSRYVLQCGVSLPAARGHSPAGWRKGSRWASTRNTAVRKRYHNGTMRGRSPTRMVPATSRLQGNMQPGTQQSFRSRSCTIRDDSATGASLDHPLCKRRHHQASWDTPW